MTGVVQNALRAGGGAQRATAPGPEKHKGAPCGTPSATGTNAESRSLEDLVTVAHVPISFFWDEALRLRSAI